MCEPGGRDGCCLLRGTRGPMAWPGADRRGGGVGLACWGSWQRGRLVRRDPARLPLASGASAKLQRTPVLAPRAADAAAHSPSHTSTLLTTHRLRHFPPAHQAGPSRAPAQRPPPSDSRTGTGARLRRQQRSSRAEWPSLRQHCRPRRCARAAPAHGCRRRAPWLPPHPGARLRAGAAPERARLALAAHNCDTPLPAAPAAAPRARADPARRPAAGRV
jgi:hypothetical protein